MCLIFLDTVKTSHKFGNTAKKKVPSYSRNIGKEY